MNLLMNGSLQNWTYYSDYFLIEGDYSYLKLLILQISDWTVYFQIDLFVVFLSMAHFLYFVVNQVLLMHSLWYYNLVYDIHYLFLILMLLVYCLLSGIDFHTYKIIVIYF